MEATKQLHNTNMRNLHFLLFFPLLISSSLTPLPLGQSQSFWSNQATPSEGVPSLVDLEYHMGPVLAASPTNLYVIWYGHWNPKDQSILRHFIYSLSSPSSPRPSVYDWWQTVRLYTDQTGSNITGELVLAGEAYDWGYSQGRYLSREAMQHVIRNAVSKGKHGLPLDPHSGVYLVLTSQEVQVQDFCRAVCGFHYFTFPYVVGVTVPYAWVGHSGVQCPGFCAYPFAWPSYGGTGGYELLGAPNRNPGIDGMVSVLAHELAEVSSNPLVNAWYAGDDPTAPMEIADLCMGVYGSGAGGGYVGSVYKDSWGNSFNLHGVRGTKFLVQWVWNPIMKQCFGPNSIY